MKNRIAALTVLATLAGLANAGVVFSGTGTNPEVNANASGTADFSLSGDILTVVLTNTTSPRTAAQGNTLTGVTFDVAGTNPGLDLTSTSLGGSLLWTSKTASTAVANLNGSWTDVLGASPLGEFGAASTGFAGRFNGGSISLGNAGPNYGVVAAGTFDGTNVAFGGSQFPFIQGSLTLTFSGATGMDLSKLANVQILFGTDGTGNITTTKVPAPGSLALLAMAGVAAGRRRR